MGILLAAALQLYGRAGDTLYHVLVSPEFESHQNFFYKLLRNMILKQSDGSRLHTKDAVIHLAEIPYVRLRMLLPDDVLSRSLSLNELVTYAQRELKTMSGGDPVYIDLTRRNVKIGEKEISLTPSEFGWYAALGKVKVDRCTEPARPTCAGCTACYLVLSNETWERESARLEEWTGLKIMGVGSPGPAVLPRFRSLLSKINRALEQTVESPRVAEQYAVKSIGKHYAKAYGLAVDKGAIRFCQG